MGVRVKIRIRYANSLVDVIGLVNTGYETDISEVLIPLDVAERLGLWPRLPENTIVETYRTASGLMRVYRIPGARVSLVVEGMEKGDVESYIVVSEYVDEVLISDQLTSNLNIVVEDPAKGLWRLRGEPIVRTSERRV